MKTTLLKRIIAIPAAMAAGIAISMTAPAENKTVEVEGTYRYYIPYNVPRDQAEQTAMERAMTDALAKKFGTLVSQNTQMNTRISDGNESTDFWNSAASLVMGEWVETIGKPKFTAEIENNDFVVTCTIKGRAREINTMKADLDIRVLRNFTDNSAESSTFVNGDKCFLAFTSPIEGYLTVYLEDEEKNVFRMLPFFAQKNTAQRIEAGRRYTFFASTEGDAEQYELRTSRDVERNTIYVIFSPNEYVKPIDRSPEEELALKQLDSDTFRQWIARTRALDNRLQVTVCPVTISANNE